MSVNAKNKNMSKEILDIAVFGLILGASALAAAKLRGGAAPTRYMTLSGFALLSAVSGMRVIDHFAVEMLGPESSGLVAVVDSSLTLLGLALILRGVSVWKKQNTAAPLMEESHRETSRAVSYRKLHEMSCNLALRIESLAGAASRASGRRVSALEELFEACAENLSGTLGYDCLTVELAPQKGTTAHSISRDAGSGALKVHFYPVRQGLSRVHGAGAESRPLLIRKSVNSSDSAYWDRLKPLDVKESLLGIIRLEDGYSLTIAAGSRRLNSMGKEAQFLLGEFLKLLRPLAAVAMTRARSAAEQIAASTVRESGSRPTREKTVRHVAEPRKSIDKSLASAISIETEHSDKT